MIVKTAGAHFQWSARVSIDATWASNEVLQIADKKRNIVTVKQSFMPYPKPQRIKLAQR